MGVTQRRHRDAGGEIEVAASVLGEQIGPLAPLEGEVDTVVGGHNG